jgi:fatty acid desaturase
MAGMSKEETRREQIKLQLGFIFVAVLLLIAYIKFGIPLYALFIVLVIGLFLCIILDYILYLISGRNIIFRRDWMNEEDEVRREEVFWEEERRKDRDLYDMKLVTVTFGCAVRLFTFPYLILIEGMAINLGQVGALLNNPWFIFWIIILIVAIGLAIHESLSKKEEEEMRENL